MAAIEQFFSQYGATIVAGIVAACSALSAIWSLCKMIGLDKKVKKTERETIEKIQITQDGIVKAFETAKIPSEWKISISQQVDKKLESWAEKFLVMFKEHEDLRTQLALINTQILTYTAAFNKLSDEDKQKFQEIVKQITEADKTIEV